MIRNWSIRLSRFRDVKGILRIIEGCPLNKLQILKELLPEVYALIREECEEAGETLGFVALCDRNADIYDLSVECAKLCGIKKEWMDLRVLAALIYSYEDPDGNYHRGLIAEMYFSEEKQLAASDGLSESGITFDEYYSSIFASLVGITEDPVKAYQAMDLIPSDKLENMLYSRSEQIKKANSSSGSTQPKKSQAEIKKEFDEFYAKHKAAREATR